MRRRIPEFFCAAALLLAACQPSVPAARDQAASVPVPGAGYAELRAAMEQEVQTAQQAAEQAEQIPDWTAYERLASAQLALGQLSGNYADYLAASQALARSFEQADGNGPYLTRARWNYAVHRLDAARVDLAQAHLDRNADAAQLLALDADLYFYEGRYAEALAGYREALLRREDIATLARLSLWHARMGHPSEAAALLDRAAARYHAQDPLPRAWLALQQGLLRLDAGDWDGAQAWYQRALALLPGWWLAREHQAEILNLQGHRDEALREYESVVADTGHPEFMDAIAAIHLDQQQTGLAAPWLARARAAHEQRLRELPEAALGHSLDHWLRHGGAAETLALAQRNAALRPYGEARIALAEAYAKAGRPALALRELRAVRESGWDTAQLHALEAQVCERAGQAQAARDAWARARRLNPRSAQMYVLPVASS